MKLIIDIPEEDYKTIIQRPKQCFVHWDIVDALRNGTPLDDVKAEISIIETYERDGCWVMADVLEVLDNIGKAESEDKK